MKKLKIVKSIIDNMKIFLIAFFFLLILCVSDKVLNQKNKFAKEINSESLGNKLDELMPSLMDNKNIPGASLAVIQNSKAILIKSYGVQNAKTQKAITNETVYEFASLSKPVFAFAVLQLANKGIIDLDKPLYKYLELKSAAHDVRYKQITARMVLSHTTGFPNWTSSKKYIPIYFTPGKRFKYSGEGYCYLQKVIEKITGKHLQQIVDEHIFTPLQMNHSSFIWKNEFQVNMAFGHSENGMVVRGIRKWEGVSSSSLITDIRDYSKFICHILKEYKKGNPIINNMIKPIIKVMDDGKGSRLLWSLGWGIEETKQGNSIWHWGNNGEFRSLIVANLESGNGLVYVANSSSGLQPITSIIQNTIGGVHPLTKFSKVY